MDPLTTQILSAISDEWFAHYQYWIGSLIVDARYSDVISQFQEHSRDEFDHAIQLAHWVSATGNAAALPFATNELPRHQHCGYTYPSSRDPKDLIQESIDGERCAIEFYSNLLYGMRRARMSEGDRSNERLETILREILNKEKEHLADLKSL